MPRRSYAIAVTLLLSAMAAALVLFVQNQSNSNSAAEARSYEQAAYTEAQALNRVATAEVQAARTEFDASVMQQELELLKLLLPVGQQCETTTTTEEATDTDPATSTTTETCVPRAPSDEDVEKALARLTIGEIEGTPTVASQILPVNRLLPDDAGNSWQVLAGIEATGGRWEPQTPPGTGRHVLTFSNGLSWQEIGTTGGGGSIGDITHISAGTGIEIDNPDTSTPSIRLADGTNPFTDTLLTKLSNVEAGAQQNVQSDWSEADASSDAFIANKPDASHFLPDYLQAETEILHSRAGTLFWEGINEVPDTPGDAAGVRHALVVTGENDGDYSWRDAEYFVPLSTGGGLAWSTSGQLHTSPSIVTTAEGRRLMTVEVAAQTPPRELA